MKAELKAKWVEALRSGKYQQGLFKLKRHDNTYCCLGVLLHCVHPRSRVLNKARALSTSHMQEFGMTDDQQDKLIGLNDNGKSFKYIAKYIEKHL